MKRMMVPIAGGVSPLEDNDEPLLFFLHPALQFDELHLERELLPLVLLALHTHAVRLAPAPKGVGRDLAKQNGIVDIEARQLLARADLLEQQVMGHVPPPPLRN